MSKHKFKHKCSMPLKTEGMSEKNGNRVKKNTKGKDSEQLSEIYKKYYKNQLAALYNAVRGY